MAVAADSHCDFLIPGEHRPAVPPTTEVTKSASDELRYSFVGSIIPQFEAFFKCFCSFSLIDFKRPM